MKFGVNTLIWSATFGAAEFDLLSRIRDQGFDGVEIPLFEPRSFDAASVARALDRAGLERTAVTVVPPGSGLGESDPEARRRASAHLEACVEVAGDAGISVLGGPMYMPVGHFTGSRRTSDEWQWTVDAWQRLRAPVRAAGIEIAIEPLNRYETYFLNTVDDGVRLCAEVGDPAIGLLFDTFHANIEERSIAAAFRRAAAHITHVHACENDRGTPGSGHVPWDEFFDAVADTGYDRWLTIESFGFALGPVSAAASIWRDLASSPEAIAFDGIEFLRMQTSERQRASRANGAGPRGPRE